MQNFTFLEFGFAPGGITKFMLDIDKRISGAGVTLPTAIGGFGIVEELKENSRFEIYEAKLVEEAKAEDGKDLTRYQHKDLENLNLIINGTTGHSNEYKRSQGIEITSAQMYYTLTSLGDGGMVLVVMNAILTFRT